MDVHAHAHCSGGGIAGGETRRSRGGPPRRPRSAGAWSLLALAVALFAGAGASIWFGAGPAPDPGERNDLIAEVARLETTIVEKAIELAALRGKTRWG